MPRNNVLDIAKFWAILSVLAYHVVRTFVHWETVGSFIDTYFLTMFFFVSGLLTKDSKVVNGWCKKQVKHLLLPFASCWLLYRLFLLFTDGTMLLAPGAVDDAKGGYWFIFVLFLFNIFLWILKQFTDKTNNKLLKLFILTIPFVFAAFLCLLLPYNVAGYFSLMSVRRYWLFFAYGYAISNLWHCNRILKDKRYGIAACCLYLPMACYYTVKVIDVNTNFDFAFWFATNAVAMHAWLYLFYKLESVLCNRAVFNVGMNTLGIYVFHYYPLHILTVLIGGGKYTFENTGMLLIPIVLFFTILLLLIAYIITYLVKQVKPLSRVLLGTK